MFITIDGLKTYYETVGVGEPILLLHGWGVDARSLRPILTHLRERNIGQIIAPDFPGFGRSETPARGWTVGNYATFLSAFLDALALGPATVIAHSFGGRVIIKLADQQPGRVRRLVLVGSAGIRPERNNSYRARVWWAKILKQVGRMLPGRVGDLFAETVLARQGSADYRQASGSMKETFVKVVNEDLRHHLPAIQAPTLLLWGDQDQETPLNDGRLMAQLLSQGQLIILPGAGHYCYLDDFPAFSQALDRFLEETA